MTNEQQMQVEALQRQLDELSYQMRELNLRLENAINQAAILAIHDAFALLGVDVNNPTDLQRFRDDLRFGGVFRSAATKGFFALVAAIFGGIGLSIWISLKDNFGFK